MLFPMHGFTHQKKVQVPMKVQISDCWIQVISASVLNYWGLEDTLQVHTKKILSCFSLCSQSRTTVPKRTCRLIYQLNSLQDIWESRKSKKSKLTVYTSVQHLFATNSSILSWRVSSETPFPTSMNSFH